MSRPEAHGVSDATTYRRLLGLLRPYRLAVGVTLCAMVIDSLCMTLFAKEIKPLIDKLFVVRDPHVIFWMPIIIIGIFFVRSIAVARILMPASMVRLSAGRESRSDELQALCFAAGANSIFYGEKLLTTGNPDTERDMALFARLGLRPMQVEAAADDALDSGSGPACSTTFHAGITAAA